MGEHVATDLFLWKLRGTAENVEREVDVLYHASMRTTRISRRIIAQRGRMWLGLSGRRKEAKWTFW